MVLAQYAYLDVMQFARSAYYNKTATYNQTVDYCHAIVLLGILIFPTIAYSEIMIEKTKLKLCPFFKCC